MPTRRQALFSSRPKAAATNIVPATVSWQIDKKRRMLKEPPAHQKMICALRMALTDMSDEDENQCRYYIDNNRVLILKNPSDSPAKDGESRTYHGAGRVKLGVCHPGGHVSWKFVEFHVTFRDTVDERGLPTVQYIDPTSIEEIPKGSPIDLSALA